VTPEMALRLGKLCGNGPELWLALQTRFDLERLRREKTAEIEAIQTSQAALSRRNRADVPCCRGRG
jgi:plasmid maintenance system antidote protein VapI